MNQELSRPWGDIYYSQWIDDAAEAQFYGYNSEVFAQGAAAWNLWKNCAPYASGAWEAATGEDLNDKNGIGLPNPNSLGKSIKAANAADAESSGTYSGLLIYALPAPTIGMNGLPFSGSFSGVAGYFEGSSTFGSPWNTNTGTLSPFNFGGASGGGGGPGGSEGITKRSVQLDLLNPDINTSSVLGTPGWWQWYQSALKKGWIGGPGGGQGPKGL